MESSIDSLLDYEVIFFEEGLVIENKKISPLLEWITLKFPIYNVMVNFNERKFCFLQAFLPGGSLDVKMSNDKIVAVANYHFKAKQFYYKELAQAWADTKEAKFYKEFYIEDFSSIVFRTVDYCLGSVLGLGDSGNYIVIVSIVADYSNKEGNINRKNLSLYNRRELLIDPNELKERDYGKLIADFYQDFVFIYDIPFIYRLVQLTVNIVSDILINFKKQLYQKVKIAVEHR